MNIDSATSAQRAAIESDADEILVLAGPGSGKTATLVARIRRLLSEGVKPEGIAVITFTNAGARELEERLANEYAHNEPVEQRKPYLMGHCGTLHSFCLKLLRKHRGATFGVISPDSALDLLNAKAEQLRCKDTEKQLVALKANGRPDRGIRLTVAETVVASYYDELAEANLADYDSLLAEAFDLIHARKESFGFTHLFVDEVQDSAEIDWAIYDFLEIAKKFFVGDPDQAIYSFRGGAVMEILRRATEAFHGEKPKLEVIRLEDNFRSLANICAAAQTLIEHNRQRVAKDMIAATGSGGTVSFFEPMHNEGEEIGMVARKIRERLDLDNDRDLDSSCEAPDMETIAVLSRTNSIANAFRKTLAAAGIPVIDRQPSTIPFDWTFARSVVELASNPENDSLAYFYLIRLYEKRGASPKEAREAANAARQAASSVGHSLNRANIGLARYATAAEFVNSSAVANAMTFESRMLIAEKFRELPENASVADLALAIARVNETARETGEGVQCLTIHGAKGREFDTVFLVGFEEEVIPGRARHIADPDKCRAAIEEERRLAYVGITRARSALYVSCALSRLSPWGKIESHTPSRFIAEMSAGAKKLDA